MKIKVPEDIGKYKIFYRGFDISGICIEAGEDDRGKYAECLVIDKDGCPIHDAITSEILRVVYVGDIVIEEIERAI